MKAIDLHRNAMPVCPWCEHELQELAFSGVGDKDGDRAEISCENCHKKYSVHTEVTFVFTTKAIGCELHKLRKESEHIKLYECIDCHNQFYDWQLPGGEHPRLKQNQYMFVQNAP